MTFETNVFVNCPLDLKYLPLLRPLLFTIYYLGFTPRIALERLDSGEPRIHKLLELIEASKFGIHDLSRLRADRKGEFYRLNMPFELGLDVGCRLYKGGRWSQKKCLILETQPYRFHAAISDLSNSDIAVHGDDPERLTTEVRNWLNHEGKLSAPGPSAVWGAFLDFMQANYDDLKQRGYSDQDIKNLPVNELMTCIRRWVNKAL